MSSRRRRGLVLFVVLLVIALLALLAASYSFMVNANLHTAIANQEEFQAQMAAESGIQFAIASLREGTPDLTAWYSNPNAFRGFVVHGTGNKSDEAIQVVEDDRVGYDPQAERVWRVSLVAPNYEIPTTVRYGVTDECSKLDLNAATEGQLATLFTRVIPQSSDQPVEIPVLIDSLLDWREKGGGPRPNGAKDEYYGSLKPPYKCKQAPFTTVEELLMVRGFTAWVVYGEDYNRNGLLDPNEDDGDATFPPDNGDGSLFPGVSAFLTVWSREANVGNDNRPRINLNEPDLQKLQDALEEEFDGAIVSYVMGVRGSGGQFNSVMNLLPAPPTPELEEDESELAPDGETGVPAQGDGTRDGQQIDMQNAGELLDELTDADETGTGSENAPTSQPARGPTSQPAQPQRPTFANLTAEPPPGEVNDLPLLLDRLTAAATPGFTGRVNVSTAPRSVLLAIEGLTEAQVDALLAARRELDGTDLATPAWLLTAGVLDEYTFRVILPKITTRGSVFRVESVGYADNLGVVARLNVVFEMRGMIPQVVYYRNLSGLGTAYMPHGDEVRGATDKSET